MNLSPQPLPTREDAGRQAVTPGQLDRGGKEARDAAIAAQSDSQASPSLIGASPQRKVVSTGRPVTEAVRASGQHSDLVHPRRGHQRGHGEDTLENLATPTAEAEVPEAEISCAGPSGPGAGQLPDRLCGHDRQRASPRGGARLAGQAGPPDRAHDRGAGGDRGGRSRPQGAAISGSDGPHDAERDRHRRARSSEQRGARGHLRGHSQRLPGGAPGAGGLFVVRGPPAPRDLPSSDVDRDDGGIPTAGAGC